VSKEILREKFASKTDGQKNIFYLRAQPIGSNVT